MTPTNLKMAVSHEDSVEQTVNDKPLSIEYTDVHHTLGMWWGSNNTKAGPLNATVMSHCPNDEALGQMGNILRTLIIMLPGVLKDLLHLPVYVRHPIYIFHPEIGLVNEKDTQSYHV